MYQQDTAESFFRDVFGEDDEEKKKSGASQDTAESFLSDIGAGAQPKQVDTAESFIKDFETPAPQPIQQPPPQPQEPYIPQQKIPLPNEPTSPTDIMAVESGPNLINMARDTEIEKKLYPEKYWGAGIEPTGETESWLREQPEYQRSAIENLIKREALIKSTRAAEAEEEKKKKSIISDTAGGTLGKGIARDIKGAPKVVAGGAARGGAEAVKFVDKLSRLAANLMYGAGSGDTQLPKPMTPEEESKRYGVIQDVYEWGDKIISDTQMNPIAKGVFEGIGALAPTLATLTPFMRGAEALTMLSPAMRSAVGFAAHGALKGLSEGDVKAATRGAIAGGTLGPILSVVKAIRPKYIQMLAEGAGFTSSEAVAQLIMEGKLPSVEDATTATLLGMIFNIYGQQKSVGAKGRVERLSQELKERQEYVNKKKETLKKEDAEIGNLVDRRIDEIMIDERVPVEQPRTAQQMADEIRPQQTELVPPKTGIEAEWDAVREAVATKGIKKPAEKRKIELDDTTPEKLVPSGDVSGEENLRPLDTIVQNSIIDTRSGDTVARLGKKRDARRDLKDWEVVASRYGDGSVDIVAEGKSPRMGADQLREMFDAKYGKAEPMPPEYGVVDIGEIKKGNMRVKEEKFGLRTEDEIQEAMRRHGERINLRKEGRPDEEIIPIDGDYEPGLQTYRDHVDHQDEVRRLVKHIRKYDVDIPEESNPFLKANYARSVGRIAEKWLKGGIERDGELIAKGPVAIIDEFAPQSKFRGKVFEEKLGRFWIHRRNLLDLQRMPSVKGAKRNIATETEVREAREFIDDLAKNHPQEYALMERASVELKKFNKAITQEMVDAKLISPESAAEMEALNENYVTFMRLFPVGVDRGAIKKLVEDGALSDQQANEVLKSTKIDEQLDRLYELRKNGNITSEQYDTAIVSGDFVLPGGETRKPLSGAVLQRIKGNTRMGVRSPFEAMVGKTNQVVDQIARNKLKLAIVEWADYFPNEMWRTTDVTTRKTGIPNVMKTPPEEGYIEGSGKGFNARYKIVPSFGDTRMAYNVSKALYDAIQDVPSLHVPFIGGFLKAARNMVRTSATIVPEFSLVRNPIRDTVGAFIQVSRPSAEYGTKGGKKVVVAPIIDPVMALFDVIGKTDVYKAYEKSGGPLSGMIAVQSELGKTFKELRNPYGRTKLIRQIKAAGGVVLHPIKSAQKVTSALEEATRVATFKALKKAGYSDEVAGVMSRESSVDFGRMGLVGGQINQIVPFYNAGVQGTDRFVRSMKDNPLATMVRIGSAVVLPEVLLHFLNRDNKKYHQYPDWMKAIFHMIPIPGTDIHFKVPKPFIYAFFGSMVRRTLDYWHNGNPEAYHNTFGDFLQNFSPIGASGIEGLIPAGIKPILENTLNYNFFLERPIVSPYSEDKMPHNKFHRYTSRTVVAIGKMLGMSPAKIENLLRGYFTGLADWGLKLSDAAIKKIKQDAFGRPGELGAYPFTRAFFTRTGIELSKTQSIYYESFKRAKELYDDVSSQNYEPDDSADIVYIHRVYQRVNSALSELADEEQAIIQANLSDEQKFNELEKIALEKEELYMTALSEFKRKPRFWSVPKTISNFLR